MPSVFRYNRVLKYIVKAELVQPMHVGSAGGDPEEVLIHPVDERPYLQAAGIAGVFRNAFRQILPEREDDLFGSSEEGDDACFSRIVFSDGRLVGPDRGTQTDQRTYSQGRPAALEFRPRIKIDRETGTAGTNEIKATRGESGGRFNMQYVGAGTQLVFSVYILSDGKHEGDDACFRTILGTMENGIQFGGQRSNGCGYVKPAQILFHEYDLTNPEECSKWMEEDHFRGNDYTDILGSIKSAAALNAYEVEVKGRTEGSLLVKAMIVPDVGENAPDDMNMQNAAGDYVIPGSSLKGAVRVRMEEIAEYLASRSGIDAAALIENAFGTDAQRLQENKGKPGNLRFRDTIVGSREEDDMALIQHRIHIDKFTGGVMHGALFSTKDVHGKVDIRINITNRNNPDQTLALLLFALRDLADGSYNLGSGYNVGKGFITVERIDVKKPGENQSCRIAYESAEEHRGRVSGDQTIIRKALKSLGGLTE